MTHNKQQGQSLGGGRIWFLELPYYRIQNFQFSTKKYKTCRETRYNEPSQGNKFIEIVPEKAQTLNLLDQDFKSAALKYAQQAKGNLNK